MGDRALLRPHAVHVRPLLRHPGQRRARSGAAFRGDQGTTLRETVGIDGGSVAPGVRLRSSAHRRPRRPGRLARETGEPVLEMIARARAGDDVARRRRSDRLAADRDPDRARSRRLRPRSLLDRAGMIFVLIGVSAHPLWIGADPRATSSASGSRWTPIAGYCAVFDALRDVRRARCSGRTTCSCRGSPSAPSSRRSTPA